MTVLTVRSSLQFVDSFSFSIDRKEVSIKELLKL